MTPTDRVLLVEPIHSDGIGILSARAEVTIAASTAVADVEAGIARADAVIVRSSPLDARLIGAGKRLRVIGRHGVGVDNIDVAAAHSAGIVVVNTPTANATSVAEFTIALLLTAAKNLVPAIDALRDPNVWVGDRSLPSQAEGQGLGGIELAGRILGLVGFGAIGRAVAVRARGLDMHVMAHDPFVGPEIMEEYKVSSCSALAEVLAAADFVSVHVPGSAGTTGLFGREQIRLMKPGAYLINTARGDVVDERALVEAIDDGHLAGAAIDVFTVEPPDPRSHLLRHPKIVATPHIAAMTEASRRRMAIEVAEGVLTVLEGRTPASAVGRAVGRHAEASR